MKTDTLIEVGWKKLACGHIVRLPYDDTPCPTCAEIKAAEDRRGKEVLEMALSKIANAEIKKRNYKWPYSVIKIYFVNLIRQAHQEQFGES